MIIISDILNGLLMTRLKNKNYRHKIFLAALNHELRHKKIGKALLRNLNQLMSSDTSIHNEFTELVGKENFQTKFWESDLGYLWFEGNANANKPYFNEAVQLIKRNSIQSLLDVGCGWGVFCNKCIQETKISSVKGIDISEGVIQSAQNKFKNGKLSFEVKDAFLVSEKYDLVTIFGSVDYIHPDKIEEFVVKLIDTAKKNVLIVHSLRKISIEDLLMLNHSSEIKRYDIGYVHPLQFILNKYKEDLKFTFTITRSGLDSALVIVSK